MEGAYQLRSASGKRIGTIEDFVERANGNRGLEVGTATIFDGNNAAGIEKHEGVKQLRFDGGFDGVARRRGSC